jgi:serine/threonine-protein kinase RsbW
MEQRYANLAEGGQRLLLSFPAETEELAQLGTVLEAFAEVVGWPADRLMQANLVLEELACNSAAHGRASHIAIRLDALPDGMRIEFEDDGQAFDPFSQAAPDMSLTLEQRPIGGLGIHLVRSTMDTCAYAYIDGHNRLTLQKRYPPDGG